MSPKKSSKTVGLIGLGIMGGSFSRNLIAAGWRVVGFDIDARKRAEMSQSRREDCRGCQDRSPQPRPRSSSPACRSPRRWIATAPKAIATAGLPPRRIVAECSTFTIEDKEKAENVLRAAGHIMLDCPVSGTGSQAQDRRSRGLCQRRPQVRSARYKPLFAGFSRKLYDVGPFGNGSRMKYVANLLVAINNVGGGPGDGARHEGRPRPRARSFEMISELGAGNSRVFELRAPMMVKNRLQRRHHENARCGRRTWM